MFYVTQFHVCVRWLMKMTTLVSEDDHAGEWRWPRGLGKMKTGVPEDGHAG
jgi:hypothetical protein